MNYIYLIMILKMINKLIKKHINQFIKKKLFINKIKNL